MQHGPPNRYNGDIRNTILNGTAEENLLKRSFAKENRSPKSCFSLFFFNFFLPLLRRLSAKSFCHKNSIRKFSTRKFLKPRRHFHDLENVCRSKLGECLRSSFLDFHLPPIANSQSDEIYIFSSLGFKYLKHNNQSPSGIRSFLFFDDARVSAIATSVELFA